MIRTKIKWILSTGLNTVQIFRRVIGFFPPPPLLCMCKDDSSLLVKACYFYVIYMIIHVPCLEHDVQAAGTYPGVSDEPGYQLHQHTDSRP